ncbi:MAG: M1 family metallopeptidase [Polyangiaceae bacterium]|nr:M1 family metallopeptidase [Polyangiaceae bacterium]
MSVAFWLCSSLLFVYCGHRSERGAIEEEQVLASNAPLQETVAEGLQEENTERKELNRVDYHFDLRFSPETHELTGTQEITLKNNSTVSIPHIYFHLFLNAFEHENTRFFDQGAGRSGVTAPYPYATGKVEIVSITSPDWPGELREFLAKTTPGDQSDRTDLEFKLPKLLPPGGELRLRLIIKSRLPKLVERSGFSGEFHFWGQFFPKVAHISRTGEQRHFAYDSRAEFFSNFGDYRLRLETPPGWELAGTGRITQKHEKATSTVWEIEAKNVHDFAFALSRELEIEERSIQGHRIRLMLHPRQEWARQPTWDTLERVLPTIETALFPYPYPELAIVFPPLGAEAAGGMEYPSLITTGGQRILHELDIPLLEIYLIHELLHQWFQSAVASDEAKTPFLDESLTTYFEWRFLEETRERHSTEPRLAFFSRPAFARFVSLQKPGEPLFREAQAYESFQKLGREVYSRAPLLLRTLANLSAPGEFDQAFGQYAREFAFSHPSRRDFLEFMKTHLAGFAFEALQQASRERWSFDARLIINERGEPVAIEKHGNLDLPITVELVCIDGQRHRQLIKTKESTWLIPSTTCELAEVTVDPELKNLVDENLENNSWRAEAAPRRRLKQLLAVLMNSLWQGLSP